MGATDDRTPARACAKCRWWTHVASGSSMNAWVTARRHTPAKSAPVNIRVPPGPSLAIHSTSTSSAHAMVVQRRVCKHNNAEDDVQARQSPYHATHANTCVPHITQHVSNQNPMAPTNHTTHARCKHNKDAVIHAPRCGCDLHAAAVARG